MKKSKLSLFIALAFVSTSGYAINCDHLIRQYKKSDSAESFSQISEVHQSIINKCVSINGKEAETNLLNKFKKAPSVEYIDQVIQDKDLSPSERISLYKNDKSFIVRTFSKDQIFERTFVRLYSAKVPYGYNQFGEITNKEIEILTPGSEVCKIFGFEKSLQTITDPTPILAERADGTGYIMKEKKILFMGTGKYQKELELYEFNNDYDSNIHEFKAVTCVKRVLDKSRKKLEENIINQRLKKLTESIIMAKEKVEENDREISSTTVNNSSRKYKKRRSKRKKSGISSKTKSRIQLPF